MSCKAVVRQVNNVTVVDLIGRITLGEGSGTIRNSVKDLLQKGNKQILLNLAEVSYIDSAGLGELVGAYATVSNQKGEIKLLNTQNKVHDLLQVTKLFSVFEAFTDEAAALKSFPQTSAGAR